MKYLNNLVFEDAHGPCIECVGERRRAWPPGDTHRPVKRLFTPEIKRMLKDWLVRRRENPYPSREEKKQLAHDTGLTYTQICNWFANWRRKLKNSGREPSKKSWGHLIKNYNVNAKGNVEQFSICSNDSIWGDDHNLQHSDSSTHSGSDFDDAQRQHERSSMVYSNVNVAYHEFPNKSLHSLNDYYTENLGDASEHSNYYTCSAVQPQCFQVSSTTDEKFLLSDEEHMKYLQQGLASNPKYKQQMMEKYLRDTRETSGSSTSPELSKWLESAARFTPNKHNYIDWNFNRSKPDQTRSKSQQADFAPSLATIHEKEELDAAEALANLACNYRQRLLNTTA